MHYLVTGGCGFIGRHLCAALIADGYQVTVIDDLSTGDAAALPAGVSLITGTVTDAAIMAPAFECVDGVFHLAAIASVQRCKEKWAYAHAVNCGAFVQLLELAAKHGNLPMVYMSSAAVYGDNTDVPLSEQSVTQPISSYGLDKLNNERYAALAQADHGLASVGLRLFNIYGVGQQPDSPYSGVMSIFAEKLRRGEDLTIFGDGEQSRDFVYVGDVVRAAQAAMSKAHSGAHEVVNVCTGYQTRVQQLAEMMIDVAGADVAIHHVGARAGDIMHSLGDNSHMHDVLGVGAMTLLADALPETVQQLVNQRSAA